MFPFDNPDIVDECEVPPVAEKVFGIEENATFGVVEYLQFAFSFVVTLNVAVVVPAGKVPVGWPFEIIGGAVSLTTLLTLTDIDVAFVFPLVSLAVALIVCKPLVNVVVFNTTE